MLDDIHPTMFCSQAVSFLNDFCCFNQFLLRSFGCFQTKTALWEEVVGLFWKYGELLLFCWNALLV